MRYAVRIILVLGCFASGSATPAETDSGRIPIPNDVFYYRSAASVFGSESAWNNPAGMARFGAAGFQIMADYSDGDYAKSWGTAVYRDRLTTAFRKVHNPDGANFEEVLTAAGFGMGPAMKLGVSYRYFREGPGIYNNRHFWNVGLQSQGHGAFAFAAVLSNLNRGKIDGERSATEQRYAIGYRPIGPRLTLTADMLLATTQKLSEATYVYQAEYIPTQGLYVNAFIDSDQNFQVGVRVNFAKYFLGSQSHFDKNGHGGRTTAFFGATNMRQPSIIRDSRRNLALSVKGRLAENPPQPVFGRKGVPFVSLIMTVYRAAEDPSIASMNLNLSRLGLGFGQAQELREALGYFKAGGKRIICHLTSPNNIGYYVASIADTVLIPPVSQLRLVGLRAELTFWAGTLDKAGVNVELLRVGDYKTAPEGYTREASSVENREQLNRMLDDLYDQFVTGIAAGRGLAPDSVRAIIDRGPFSSAEALEIGLVDGLTYRDRVRPDFFPSLPTISFSRYLRDTLINDSWQPRPEIAIVVAEGEITSDAGEGNILERSGGVRPGTMAHAYEKARTNSNVRGLVLRVNSPGGWALAGDAIYHSGTLAAESKPMAVSMANVAGSGGYYIAMAGHPIFVNPATVTGSIGIYGGKVDFSGLHEKLAIGKELYTRGRYAGMLTTTRPFTDDERAKYRSHLTAFYDHFVDLVAENRTLPNDSVDNLGRGRVWTGREALSHGLADEPGGIKQALSHIADELGLDEYTVTIYPEKKPWFIFPGRSMWKRFVSILTGTETSPETDLPIIPISEEGSILARMPFDLTVE
jgi:protease-4